jgi:DNA-binding transcriptional regulator YhcF (GntR family)
VTPVRIKLERGSAPPASAQIVRQLRAAVDTGRLVPGERLSTVRVLAARLDVVPNTVAKAYRELERDGYLEGRGRAGTFVVDAPPSPPGDLATALHEAARTYLRRAEQLGFSEDAAERALRSAALNDPPP